MISSKMSDARVEARLQTLESRSGPTGGVLPEPDRTIPPQTHWIDRSMTISDASVPGTVNVLAHNLPADMTITLPRPDKGKWGFLHFRHLIDGGGSTAKVYIKDQSGKQMVSLNGGGGAWSAGDQNYVYQMVVASGASDYWVLSSLRTWTGTVPTSL